MRQNARVLQIISCELSGFRRNNVPAFLRIIPPCTGLTTALKICEAAIAPQQMTLVIADEGSYIENL